MTIPDNPGTALWQWVARAPLPVVMAGLLLLAGWVRAVDDKASDAAKDAAVAASAKVAEAKRVEAMDKKLDDLLKAVARIEAAKEAEEKEAAKAAAKKKEKP